MSFAFHSINYYLLFVTYMQVIYNCITLANHVSRVYCVAAVLCFLFMVHVPLIPMLNVLYLYIRMLLLLLLLLLLLPGRERKGTSDWRRLWRTSTSYLEGYLLQGITRSWNFNSLHVSCLCVGCYYCFCSLIAVSCFSVSYTFPWSIEHRNSTSIHQLLL